ncbi:MAG: helix-turn-helix domain-containing protein [Oscillospiraceae bacterium]
MTLGNKLSKLRKENNYTQEQLADILGVSRQAISKWESDAAYPETDKLIRIGELYGCSMDYLIKDSVEEPSGRSGYTHFFGVLKERKSEKTFMGLPFWQVGKNARGIVAVGLNARGIVAVGLIARGVFSFGLLSVGFLSLGFLSLGLFSLGMISLGGLSAGCFSAGIFSAGAISLGVISFGAIASGDFSVGALAIGKYFAMGDDARAVIALGDTRATGSLFEKLGKLTKEEIDEVKMLLDSCVPAYLYWAKEFIKRLL